MEQAERALAEAPVGLEPTARQQLDRDAAESTDESVSGALDELSARLDELLDAPGRRVGLVVRGSRR